MPYEWTDLNTGAPVNSGAPFGAHIDNQRALRLTAWPFRSLTRKGFVIFIGTTSVLFLLPLLALLGRSPLWVLLPFILATLALIWWFIEKSWRDARLTEVLDISTDTAVLIRTDPKGAELNWEANPYWITVTLHETGGPVPQYLTLKARDAREIELGAFLSEDERVALAAELGLLLAAFRHPGRGSAGT